MPQFEAQVYGGPFFFLFVVSVDSQNVAIVELSAILSKIAVVWTCTLNKTLLYGVGTVVYRSFVTCCSHI